MKIKFSKKQLLVLIAGGAIVTAASPAFGAFGFGDIVFDPSSYGELVSDASTEYNTYLQLVSAYNAFESNVRSFSSKQFWLTQLNLLKTVTVGNLFGETNGMTAALNNNDLASATSAWINANVAVNSASKPMLQGQAPGSSDQLAQLSMIDLSDAAAPDCINAVGSYRAARVDGATATASLQEEQLDTTTDSNSEVEQLNLLNAAEAQKMNEMQAQGALHACLAEQAAIQNMQQRNANAVDLNTASFIQQQRTANPTFAGNESSTWQTYLP